MVDEKWKKFTKGPKSIRVFAHRSDFTHELQGPIFEGFHTVAEMDGK